MATRPAKKKTMKKPVSRKRAAAGATKRRAASAKSGRGTPRLLSGGNPQIPKGYGDAPVQAYIAAMPNWKRDIGRGLDALISSAAPNLRKAVKWNSPFYGTEGKGWFLSIHCYTKFVRVGFFQGTSLSPPPAGTSKMAGVRYFDIDEAMWKNFDEKQFTNWVTQAAQLPGVNM